MVNNCLYIILFNYYMTILIGYDPKHIKLEDIPEKEKLRRILSKKSDTKKLKGITCNGLDVFRVKMDKKGRILYSITPEGKIMLLVIDPEHDYDKSDRKLQGNFRFDVDIAIEEDVDEEALPNLNALEGIDLIEGTTYQNTILFYDEEQLQFRNQTIPLTLVGPPGSGKTNFFA